VTRRYRTTRPWRLATDGAGAFLTCADLVYGNAAMLVEIWCTLTDYTPAAEVRLAQHGTTDGNLGWSIDLDTTGRPTASFYDLGTLATRITGTAPTDPPIPLVNSRPYGFRYSFLSDFAGAVSAYQFEINYGGLWKPVGGIVTGALVGVPFDSSEPISIGIPVSFTELYSFRIYSNIFGAGQLSRSRISVDPQLHLHNGETGWTDQRGGVWTLGAAEFERSDVPLPYAA